MAMKTMFVTALSDIWTTDGNDTDDPGDIRFQSGNFFKCVILSGALDVAISDVVAYVADTGYAAHTVTGTVSESDDQGAGVAMGAVTTAGERFWVRLTGPATLNTTLTTGTTAGNALTVVGANNLTLEVVGADTETMVASTVDDTNDEVLCMFPF